MVSKKLLAPLCLLTLLVVPIIININEGSSESEADYIIIDGQRVHVYPPELIAQPLTSPNQTLAESLTVNPTATLVGSPEDATIQINILLAFDEEYLAYYYYTPNNGILNGVLYAELQLKRASYWFEKVFDVGLVVVGITTWHCDSPPSAVQRLSEARKEIGYYRGMTWRGQDGVYHIVEALVVYTTELDTTPWGGFIAGWAENETSSFILRPVNYWSDDNIPEHEMSHLMNAEDGWESVHYWCYQSKCIMSMKLKTITTWEEDGVIWEVNNKVPHAGLYNEWCEDWCYPTINIWKWRYFGNESPLPPPCVGGC